MTSQYPEIEQLTSIVSRIMQVESITAGGTDDKFLAAYNGKLRKDSEIAYDEISSAVKRYDLTPLFREDEGLHRVILFKGVIDPKPSKTWINILFIILTLFSMLLAGVIYSYEGPVPENGLELILTLLKNLDVGIPFGLSLLGILMAHEFGHYLAGRYHKTAVSLPFFIPFPMSPFGTLGAFIQMKEPPKNKRILHDIGIAGPLSGLVVAIPILLIGLSLSSVETIPAIISNGGGIQIEGNSILYLLSKYVVHGELLPAPADYGGVYPVWYWVKYLFTGTPVPLGGRDVFLHPMAWAGWAGLLVTALNLIPAGQLDGGHILYVLAGKKARRVLPYILVALTLLGFAWPGWWLWVALVFFFGRYNAEPLDQITQLDGKRKATSVIGLVLFVLLFTPVPLQQILGPF